MINWTGLRQTYQRLDWWMVASMLFLMTAGVLFIYSACYRDDGLPVAGFYKKQMVWCALGLVLFVIVVALDYRRLGRNAVWLYALCLLLLVLVLLVGKKVYGAYRWLSLFGIQVQPSEFAKLGTIIVLARFLSQPARNMRHMDSLVKALLITACPFLLIIAQPDLGTAVVLAPVTVGMLFVAGTPLRTILLLLLIGGVLMIPVGYFGLSDYQKERIMVFIDPGRDPLDAGWNKIQSEIAVGSGGFTGKGYLKGTQNVLGFLPRTVAPTDFIYSVIAEEMGFVGGITVMGGFMVLLTACIHAAIRAADRFGRLMVVGIAIMLFCHIFVNIAMTIGLMPITGLPLPLISYGGSFMVSIMLSLGVVQSVYVRRYRR
ncbi:MAG: rod shape-determining protein RodA [Spartobacteria bacterium]|nr:rod shape-determining protein RodA [Spartobacteria bacterium]